MYDFCAGRDKCVEIYSYCQVPVLIRNLFASLKFCIDIFPCQVTYLNRRILFNSLTDVSGQRVPLLQSRSPGQKDKFSFTGTFSLI